jgi:hypothetical protein
MEILIKPLFFSFEKILKYCKNDPYKAKDALIQYIRKPDPKFDGYSFLLHPQALLGIVGNDIQVLDYIGLAAQRNYFDYKYLGRLGLDINLCSVPVEQLKTNRLLRIEEDYIHFIYEENYGN